MNEQVSSTPPHTEIKGRKPLRCCQCGAELPESARVEWGWVLGNSMKFCTYGCMRTKQASIDRKRAETNARKQAEKEARKLAEKQEKKAARAMSAQDETENAEVKSDIAEHQRVVTGLEQNITEPAAVITKPASDITKHQETDEQAVQRMDEKPDPAAAVHEEPASPFSGIDVIGMVSRLYLELKCLSNYIKGARMFNMCFSTDDGKLTLDTVMTDIIERVDRISKDTESILTGGQKPNENTTRNVP